MRRGRIASGVLALLAACAPGPEAAGAPDTEGPERRPNVVVFLTDDTRADWFGFEGHPFVETPTFDRLAREGVRFTRAFVTTSLCCPSRASLLTGLYAHRHGVTTNLEGDLGADQATFPSLLRAAGWRTAFIGKWHMGEDGRPRPGFDHWVSFAGQGTYFDPTLNLEGEERQAEGYVTDLLTDHAVAWIEARPADEPFCLVLSHKATHAPMAPPVRLRDRYAEHAVAPMPALADDLSGKPQVLRRGAHFGFTTREIEEHASDPVPERLPPPEWYQAPYVRRYLETLAAVDESLARIVDVLERRELAADTVLLATSDNGYLFGEHQAPDKRLAWEESIRVPLLVFAPHRLPGGRVVDELVLNVDVAPTLLELAGLERPAWMQGASLAPMLAGEEVAWREHFLYSYFRERTLLGIPNTLAIRTRDWKYVLYPESLAPNEELYDLTADPHELRNLAGDTAHRERLVDLRRRLAQEREAIGFAWPEHARPVALEPTEEVVLLDLREPTTGAGLDPAGLVGAVEGLDDHALTVTLELDGDHEGPVLRLGSEANGLALTVEGGRPRLRLASAGRIRQLEGTRGVRGARVRLELGLDLEGHAFLTVGEGPPLRAALAVSPPRRTGGQLELPEAAASRIASLRIATTGTYREP